MYTSYALMSIFFGLLYADLFTSYTFVDVYKNAFTCLFCTTQATCAAAGIYITFIRINKIIVLHFCFRRCILLLAERICNNLNGHLTSICDTFTNEYLRNAASNSFTKYDDKDFWFGLVHNGNHVWNWTDSNTSCSFNNWINGAPSKGGHCASFSISTGKWSAADCSKHKPFICMVPKEIVTDPSCPYDYVYFDKTNSCYKKLFNKTFYEANIECQKEGANLASIHSEEENRFLTIFSRTGYPQYIYGTTWIGLQKINNAWSWTDGTKVDYVSRFHNFSNGIDCFMLWQDEWIGETQQVYLELWENNNDCYSKNRAAICKMPPSS
uniref:C-type lectin domain-containing protein n=1 Tax=Acrobeloides nanus TaxID=290746 RepID=A0A914CNR2_9BILA